ncbi:glycerophosphodiester phosphodiesterase [Patescibacteria group bacterium]|nr:glycerophosphodiester phosphodiesterase [Patescibacteria group bacterium]
MKKDFQIIGHRGDGAGPDENTLASCQRAIRHGANAVELDVRLRNGELVLSHDTRRVNAAQLTDVLPMLTVPVVLHIKRQWFNPLQDRKVLKVIANIKHAPGLIVSSAWPGTLIHAKRRYPKLQTAFITFLPSWDLRFAKRLGVSAYCIWHKRLTSRVVSRARKQNIQLFAFTPNQPNQEIRKRADGVITDDVSAWRRAVSAARRG